MDGPPPQEEDFSSIPIQDRLSHKNWKARVSAYESLIKVFQNTASDTDPAFKPYINNDLLKRISADANAVAQEKGVECLVVLVKYAGETAAKTRDAVMPTLVDKCLGSTRAGTRSQALELTLQYVEVENSAAGVVNDLLPGLNAKQPKAVAGCIAALRETVRCFGVQVAPPPPILKVLPKVFSHNDKAVRAEGSSLTHVLYQYIGSGIESWLAELKPVQVKELKEAFEAMEKEGKGKGSVKPERFTRVQARELENTAQEDGAPDAVDGEASADEVALDPRAFAEPVDVVPKLSPSLHADLKSSKWKERKEALDGLSAIFSSTPRIKDAPELSEIARSLAARVASDANINCVMVAAKCIEDLAKGMMSSFSKFRETVVPPMLERLKERKVNVTDSIGAALDAVFSTVSLTDIIPDLEPALKNKNPQVKEGSLKFCARCLSSATAPIPPSQLKPLAESLAALLEDGHEGARNEAAVCLGTLMKMVGERPLNATLDGIADVRRTKVKEAFEKATVKCKAGTPAPQRSTASTAPAGKKALAVKTPKATQQSDPAENGARQAQPVGVDETNPRPKKTAAKPPARLTQQSKTTAPSKPPPAGNAKQAKAPAAAASSSLDVFKYKHTPEDAEAISTELIPPQIVADLGDPNWKTRLAALEEMTNWVEGQIETVDAEVIIRSLAKKGWTEKNFQVSSKLYGILSLFAEKCPSFGRSCVALCVVHLTEKLGDAKLKKPAGDALTFFAEKTSLQFVFNQAYDPLSKQKAPKVLADALTWINTAITEFGIAGLALRSLIDFLKSALQNSNATVRSSATKALVTVKLYAGSSIKDLIQDLNPQLLNTILTEFDKVENSPAPEPIRKSADVMNVPMNSSPTKGGHADPLDDLFPRVDLDSLLKGTTILADAKSDAWKTKKEALESLQAILDQGSNKRLKPTMGEIGQVLKARVTDTNKIVQALALDIVARISTGMGKAFDKHVRLFVLPVSTVLADQKASVRTSALQTLTAIGTACGGLETMASGIGSALETSNPVQKSTLLQWLVNWFKEHQASSNLDVNSWIPSVISSLDDRSTDVRKGAQALLPTLIACGGFEYVMQQTNSLKPASRSSAVPLIQAARPTASQIVAQEEEETSRPIASAPESPPDSPTVSTVKASNKSVGVRRKLPQSTSRPDSRAEAPPDNSATKLPSKGTGAPKRPSAVATPSMQNQSTNLGIFHGMNQEAKKARVNKDAQKWINESGPTRKDLAELLQSQMESHCSKDLIAHLFSHDHNAINDYMTGLTAICDFYNHAVQGNSDAQAICLAVLDLPLKYVSIKAHEPQSNLTSKCLDVVEAILSFVRHVNYQLSDPEAHCFVPTMIYKLGDAREQMRIRISQVIQTLPMVYPYSRLFQLLLDYGLKSKVAKTRQGALDELASILRKSGISACDPAKAFPLIAAMIADKDSQVRKSALSVLSEGYVLVGDKIWLLVGPLPAKEKTQLEERLRRTPHPGQQDIKSDSSGLPSGVVRLTANGARPDSPVTNTRVGGIPRSASPSVGGISHPSSPTRPSALAITEPRPGSPARLVRVVAPPTSPKGLPRPATTLRSRLARPRGATSQLAKNITQAAPGAVAQESGSGEDFDQAATPQLGNAADESYSRPDAPADISITISSILSSDSNRSVDALKKIQKILMIGPDTGPSSPQYLELAEHTEGLVETITLQMAHVFERPEDLILDDNFRLAKHLIQTLNNFCDHSILAESLTVDIVSSLLEELTLRLLETDDNSVKKIKDLSRFINMIILRLFATGRRMSIFRALFVLLLRIVKPFPSNGTLPDSKEAKVAELVLKCVWKLARSIPQDLSNKHLDPVELFPAIEHFLQSVPPNEWRARATNKVPCGDMPLRTIKVIIQHVVAHYGDDVYDLLSESFDDPSATIVYPYVYRILNSGSKAGTDPDHRRNGSSSEHLTRVPSPSSSRPLSPQETGSTTTTSHRHSPAHYTSPSSSSNNGHLVFPAPIEEPDPDAQLLTIIGHISSETTGALHKEGITELHQFLKAYPHKRQRVEKMLESTGAAFRKYITRALASRAAEDQERHAAVVHTLSKLESNKEADDADQLSKSREIYQPWPSGESHPTQGATSPTRTSFE